MSTTTPEPDNYNEHQHQSSTNTGSQGKVTFTKKELTTPVDSGGPGFLIPIMPAIVYDPSPNMQERPLNIPNHLGVRPDTFGWGVKSITDPNGIEHFDCHNEPGPNGLCPVCAKVIGEDKNSFYCRTFPSMMVQPRADGAVCQPINVKFFYRFHKACADPITQDMIESSILKLGVKP